MKPKKTLSKEMSVKDLIINYNKVAVKPIKHWKQSKQKLITLTNKLRNPPPPPKPLEERRIGTNRENTLQQFAEDLLLTVDKEEYGIKTGLN